MPFTTGILVGIGETAEERIDALLAIRDAHARHGHVQEVIVQNFLPKPGTGMHSSPPCDPEVFLRTIATARIVLGPTMHLQAPPNLTDPAGLADLVSAGIDDWGGVSPVTPDHVNPERPWPALDTLRAVTEAAGHTLAPRLTVYPEYVRDEQAWLHAHVRTAVRHASDLEGLARDDTWASGGDTVPPRIVGRDVDGPGASVRRTGTGRVAEVLDGVQAGQETGESEIVALLEARGPDVRAVAEVADQLRRDIVGDDVTFVRNRNINYTEHLHLQVPVLRVLEGSALAQSAGRSVPARSRGDAAAGGRSGRVRRDGGVPPGRDPPRLRRRLLPRRRPGGEAGRAADPHPRLHGVGGDRGRPSARHGPRATTCSSPRTPGLATLPGTAAEILDDEVRELICPDKINTEEWLHAHRTAHEVGLQSNVTIMFGSVERPEHVARHLLRTRDLQRETGGFTEFVPLPFVHMATPDLPHRPRPAGTDVPRGAAHARSRPHRVRRSDRQHPDLVGQDGDRRRAGRHSRRGATTSEGP